MADISVIKLPSGTSYNLKDAAARADIATLKANQTSGTHYLGVTTTALVDGDSKTTTVAIKNGETSVDTVVKQGDFVSYNNVTFMWNGTQWDQTGSASAIKALAYKDSASGAYTPAGSVSVSVTPTKATIKSAFTPEGTVSGSTTAKGTNAASAVTITPSTTSVFQMSSAGSVTAGSAAKCTLPTLTTSVSGETLTLGWSAGSFTANTPTAVTLPERAEVKNVWNGYTAATAAAQTFTGASSAISASFTGKAGTASADYTPAVSASGSFSGSAATITVK